MTGAVTVLGMETWLLLLVMSLATYRLTRLVVADTFPPVLWLRDRLAGGWRPLTDPERDAWAAALRAKTKAPFQTIGQDGEVQRYVRRARWSPYWLAELLSGPWCASGWIAAGWWRPREALLRLCRRAVRDL